MTLALNGRVLFSTLVWTFAGGLFGGLFAGLVAALQSSLDSVTLALLIGAAIAGIVTASFFGSMQSALLGSMVGVLCGLGYLMFFANTGHPLLLFLGAFVGAAGLANAMPKQTSIRTRPLAQAMSGLIGGALAGLLLALIHRPLGLSLADWPAAMIAVGAVGVLYLALSRLLVTRCSDRVSANLGGPLVAAVMATTIAAIVWLMMNSAMGGYDPTMGGYDPAVAAEIDAILAGVPRGGMGGALGGALGGFFLTLFGVELGDYTL